MMGPVNNNLGYLQYTILAVVGGLLAIHSGETLISLGGLVSFLALCRSFNMPIGHVSSQINAIVMALAGAERIFEAPQRIFLEDIMKALGLPLLIVTTAALGSINA